MYNRYLPQGGFVPVDAGPEECAPAPEGGQGRGLQAMLRRLLGRREGEGLGGLLKALRPEHMDSGDLLLLLLLLYLIWEGDDTDLLAALGAVLFMGL